MKKLISLILMMTVAWSSCHQDTGLADALQEPAQPVTSNPEWTPGEQILPSDSEQIFATSLEMLVQEMKQDMADWTLTELEQFLGNPEAQGLYVQNWVNDETHVELATAFIDAMVQLLSAHGEDYVYSLVLETLLDPLADLREKPVSLIRKTPCYDTFEQSMRVLTRQYATCLLGNILDIGGIIGCTATFAATATMHYALFQLCVRT